MCSHLGTIAFVGKGSKTNLELLRMNELTIKICSKQTLDEISYDMKISKEEILDIMSKIKDFNPKAFRDLTCILGPLDEVEMVWKKIDKLNAELDEEQKNSSEASEITKKIENLYEELKSVIMR